MPQGSVGDAVVQQRQYDRNNQGALGDAVDRAHASRSPPNTTEYSEVDSTGEAMLGIKVRKVCAISK